MDEYIIGIDIGSSKVCSAAGKIDKQGRLQILGVTSIKCGGLKKGIVVDIDSTTDSIRNSIEQLSGMVDIDIKNAYISLPVGICELIPSRGVIAVSSDDKDITKHDVERALNAARIISIPPNKEIVGVIPNQYIIDGYDNIKDPIGMSGVKLEVDAHIILAQTTVVDNLIKSVTKAGIKVNGIVLEPLAISQVAIKNDELKRMTALVDVGSDKIDISVYKRNNIIFTNMIPYGGNIITNDISICLKIPFSEAEKLKVKHGTLGKSDIYESENIKVNTSFNNSTSISTANLTQIIEARVDELFQLIRTSLEESVNYEDISSVIIVGGGVALFPGICELANEVLDKPVRIGAPEYVGASNPLYNTAVGVIKDVLNTSNINYQGDKSKEVPRNKNKALNEQKNDFEDSGVLSKIKGFLADFF